VEAKESPAKTKNKPAHDKPKKAEGVLRKMSFNDKHELENLPARITALEGEIAALQAQLADAAFYSRDPKGFGAASARLEKAQHALITAEERWLELESLREKLNSQ